MTKIALGPLLYYWHRRQVLDFYAAAADWPVDCVYLGEVVCSRRHELRFGDWMRIGESLRSVGKDVILSALALPESESDLRWLRKLVANGRFWIEANDMSAVQLAAQTGVPFVIGPHCNVYNVAALSVLRECGAQRWVAPIETSRALLAQMQARRPAGMESELFVYGRLPLAFSARCFTARARNLAKDDCRFRCLDDQDGLVAQTQDSEALLAFNGIQTQSARIYNLLPALAEVVALGVDLIRVSPQMRATAEVLSRLRACLNTGARVANEHCSSGGAAQFCDGYWHGRAGIEYVASGSCA